MRILLSENKVINNLILFIERNDNMYLYFSEEELKERLKYEVKNYCIGIYIPTWYKAEGLKEYREYITNHDIDKEPINDIISKTIIALDIFTYMYNHNKEFKIHHIKPMETMMSKELEKLYSNINNNDITLENKYLLKMWNITYKLGGINI